MKIWAGLVGYLFKFLVLLTYIGMIPVLIYAYHSLFINYDPLKVIVNLIMLVVLVEVNIKTQGGIK